MVSAKKIRNELKQLANPSKAEVLQSFFKTGPGEYGCGDKFLGITVPEIRAVAKKYTNELRSKGVQVFLKSKFHEERLFALLVLVLQFKKADQAEQKAIYNFYCKNFSAINNWDLVDLSAPYIVGGYLLDQDKSFLYKLVNSKDLWQRRISIVATAYFIRNGLFQDTLKLAEKLLNDKEDLLHKATGWMLREVGKKDFGVLNKFLKKHYQKMPRTMLRYAIERFPEKLRKAYLHGTV